MHHYQPQRRTTIHTLRKRMSDSELKLWSRIRRKQISGLQFYRQRPIGHYIVDFYCPRAQIVLQVDGPRQASRPAIQNGQHRDHYLKQQGIKVLRFDDLQILKQLDAVVEQLHRTAASRL